MSDFLERYSGLSWKKIEKKTEYKEDHSVLYLRKDGPVVVVRVLVIIVTKRGFAFSSSHPLISNHFVSELILTDIDPFIKPGSYNIINVVETGINIPISSCVRTKHNEIMKKYDINKDKYPVSPGYMWNKKLKYDLLPIFRRGLQFLCAVESFTDKTSKQSADRYRKIHCNVPGGRIVDSHEMHTFERDEDEWEFLAKNGRRILKKKIGLVFENDKFENNGVMSILYQKRMRELYKIDCPLYTRIDRPWTILRANTKKPYGTVVLNILI